MTPIEKIDAALDSVLKESGSSIEYYILSNRLSAMREAMKKIMVDSYIQGSHAARDVIMGKDKK